jgi:ABC-type polar amino acid transport system ATPase subunit
VQVENVTKRFEENTVLDEVSLTVAEHEVVCLIGASGSGKSTLLRCLNRLEVVQAGTIIIDGQTITEGKVDVNALRRKIGIVFQAYNLFPHMTVLQNVMLGPRKVRGLSKDQSEAVAYELLRKIGLEAKRTSTRIVCPADSSSVSRSRAPSRWSRPDAARRDLSALDPQLVAKCSARAWSHRSG